MRRSPAVLVATLALTAVAGSATAASVPAPDPDYADPAVWLCRPDVTDDACDVDLDATIVAADGTLTTAPFAADPEAPIDCFYVYPTISRDPGDNSDLVADPAAEGYAAANQVAPLATSCRVFAPVYRQVTLNGLGRLMGGEATADDIFATAYGDVLAAWRHYLATDNGGRGVILIGHSQGAGVLTELIASEVESHPEQAELLVAAYLAGTSVQVPPGADVGGTFASTPICTMPEQAGCVVTWSSYRTTSPPPANARFGAPGEGTVAACVNPAAVAGGAAELGVRMPGSADASILADLGAGGAVPWVDPAVGAVTTPYVELPGLVRGECVEANGIVHLAITIDGDPADRRADDIAGDLTPDWGLHLVDVNLVMGDLQRLAAVQAETWMAAAG